VDLTRSERRLAGRAQLGIGPGGTTNVVSDAPDLCTTLSQQDARGAPQALGASFLRLTAAGVPPALFPGSAASALLVDAAQVVSSSGDGRIELDAESPEGLLSGSYDLGAAGVSGQFTTRRCATLDAGAGDASFSTPQSCSVSTRMVGDRSEYDERCTLDGQTRSRECTLGAGESSWSCLCTSASGTRSACESQAAQPGIDTPPPNCCPGG
jgi:hypothetical protein